MKHVESITRVFFLPSTLTGMYLAVPTLSLSLQKVLNHAAETWICFIRIMVQDPFDNQLDIRVIHDREEVGPAVLLSRCYFDGTTIESETSTGHFGA